MRGPSPFRFELMQLKDVQGFIETLVGGVQVEQIGKFHLGRKVESLKIGSENLEQRGVWKSSIQKGFGFGIVGPLGF